MSFVQDPPSVPTPRVVLVLAGAAREPGRAPTALELASMPQLAGLANVGRVGRLRAVAAHLPPTETSAAATSLGMVPPMALDPGAVAIEALGRALATDEHCTVVEVLDLFGDPAPALDVERAESILRHQLRWQRVIGVVRGHQVLVAGAVPAKLPEIEGLRLNPLPAGFLPPPLLHGETVVVAAEGSMLLGVGSLLGATTLAVDATRADVRDPVPGRLRTQATSALIDGASTIVIESRAAISARRNSRDAATAERAVATALSMLDRELVGPLRAATSWTGAALVVTADVLRDDRGRPVLGEVPIVMSGPRDTFLVEPAPLLSPLGTAPVPAHSERGVAELPVVGTPHALLPARDPGAPRRFRRDPVTGITSGVAAAA